MMDDWVTAARTRAKVERNLEGMCDTLVGAGHAIQKEKNEVSQQLVYLGILIDSNRMMVSFEPAQCKGMAAQLRSYLVRIRNLRGLDGGTIRSVSGSLNWYAEVLQSGRVHVRSWWLYSIHRERINQAIRAKLIRDTQWWIGILEEWSRGGATGLEYPIFSAGELVGDSGRVYFVQSDASGDDGFGYLYGSMGDQQPRFYSQEWGGDYVFQSSHNGELQALRCFLSKSEINNKVLIWVSDSLSAVWSLNKGRCHADISMVTLEDILCECDEKRLQILGIWVPRELNEFADYLSHLSHSMDRSAVSGWVGAGGSLRFEE
jgi:hypothetical protein